jgi:hypothetical protein
MIEAIETKYNGHRFRSRVEARWAVFLDEAGISYEYEKEGFVLEDGTKYLPDFWLPDIGMWLEIKGGTATEDEDKKAELLARLGKPVLLAEGQPDSSKDNIRVFGVKGHGAARYRLMNDRKNDGEFWLSSGGAGFSIGPVDGPDHGKNPVILESLERAYTKAKEARFEHGETPSKRQR